MEKLRFVIEEPPSDKAADTFTQAKQAHYQMLLGRDIAGGAWFRHQLRNCAAMPATGPTPPR